jgi:hypothetical protein
VGKVVVLVMKFDRSVPPLALAYTLSRAKGEKRGRGNWRIGWRSEEKILT